MRELSKEYLQHNYIDQGKTRYQISAETGVDPTKIGSMLQQYGLKRYSVKRHGLVTHPLNAVWCGMKERCTNPYAENYKWYGGIGISVCEEWMTFEPFYNWAISNGWKPGLTLDRIDGTIGYTPDNCRFVDMRSQSRNRRSNVHITIDDETHLQCEWEEIFHLRKKIISKWKYLYGNEEVVRRLTDLNKARKQSMEH